MLNRILNLIIATCLTLVSFGQIGNISGVVSDSLGQKIMGAAIVVKGTNSGSITDENARNLEIDFSFLDSNSTYEAKIYKDGTGAHWDVNPLAIEFETIKITKDAKLKCHLAAGGGFSMSIQKLHVK